jgi:hypothetical protein
MTGSPVEGEQSMHTTIYYIFKFTLITDFFSAQLSHELGRCAKKKHGEHILLQKKYLLRGNLLLERHEFCCSNCWGYSNLSHLIKTYAE